MQTIPSFAVALWSDLPNNLCIRLALDKGADAATLEDNDASWAS